MLFQTNVGHAGEWMDEILFHRPEGLGAPLVMSDALSSNAITTTTVRRGLCNAHARRGFVEVAASYPDQALFALETYQAIWAAERHCIVEGLDPEARLAWHRRTRRGPWPSFGTGASSSSRVARSNRTARSAVRCATWCATSTG